MTTLIFLLLTTLFWGVWGFSSKLAVEHAHPYVVQWMYALPFVAALPVWYLLGRNADPANNHDPLALLWAVVAGASTILGILFFLFALRDRPASGVVAFTAAYPIVTLFLAVLAKQESLTGTKVLGILLVVAGLVVLQLGES